MDHISADLWDDPRFVMCAVKRAPGALEHAQPEIKASLWAEKYGGVVNLRPPKSSLNLNHFSTVFRIAHFEKPPIWGMGHMGCICLRPNKPRILVYDGICWSLSVIFQPPIIRGAHF